MAFISGLVILIIIIIIVIWFTHYLYVKGTLPKAPFRDLYDNVVAPVYNEYFADPEYLYNKTVGHENDKIAKLAIKKAEKKDQMYSTHEDQGKISRTKMGDAANNSFILANLYSYNAAPEERPKAKNKAAHYFNKTMSRIITNPVAVMETTRQPAEFMIDRAEDFYNDYLTQLEAQNNQHVQEIFLPQIPVPNFNQIRNVVRNARQNVAAATPVPKVSYYQQNIPSDPQNVHDSKVNNDMNKIYQKIKQNNVSDNIQKDPNMELTEIRDAIYSHPFKDNMQKGNALQIIDRMATGQHILSLGDTEQEVLRNVWRRINSPTNAEHKQSLHEAFVDAVSEGMEKDGSGQYREVCTTGRCARLLGSLTLLDSDPEIAKPMKTKEVLRNEAFSKAYQVIQSRLSSSPKELVDIYNGVTPDKDGQLAKLHGDLKTEIDTVLRNDYKDVDNKTLTNLIKDAQAGVEV